MRIDEIRTLPGPNIYSYHPALLMKLSLDELTGRESREIPGFNERLVALLPGLRTHACSRNHAGGFVERLDEGTYFAHIVEHICLEQMALCGLEASHGKTRNAGVPGPYYVVVETRAEQGVRMLLQSAFELAEALLKDRPYPLEERLERARKIIVRMEFGPSTQAIVEAAERRGIPWRRLDGHSLVQLGYGKHRRLIKAAMCDSTSAIGVDIASDKEMTKSLLRCGAIPVPRGEVVSSAEQATEALRRLNPPVAVKPLDAQQGRGVTLGVATSLQVEAAFHIASRYANEVLVEELFTGRDYRALIIGGRLIAASERVPAHIVGDGQHTIAELIEAANRDPRRGDGQASALTRMEIDSVTLACLGKRGWTLESVPAAGARVLLREMANLSTGGTTCDVTDKVHPEVAEICERAALLTGLDICAIDLILNDISKPPEECNGIIEINAAPGLRMHLAPNEGARREVGEAIIDHLYPAGAQSRVPIISITGTNGKTTITRLIAHALSSAGLRVGMTTTDGIYLDRKLISRGDTTGPRSARAILSNPAVEAAVLETARGGIAREGLGYDWSDIAVISNIRADHIGQDGIDDLEDILWIKSLVAERVRENGTLVLNADDPLLARLPESPRVSEVKKRIVWFSLSASNAEIQRHLIKGGAACIVKDGWIVEACGKSETPIIRAADIPMTFGGAAEFQIANALAATAACRAYGLRSDQVAEALLSFEGNTANVGRANLYRIEAGSGGAYLLVDYGHNPDAFEAVCRMAARWSGRRITGVGGVPGDRSDSLIEEAGRAAARGFDRILIKEDKDLRGRRSGEVADLLCRAVRHQRPEAECRLMADEMEALRTAIAEAVPEEVIVSSMKSSSPWPRSSTNLALDRQQPFPGRYPSRMRAKRAFRNCRQRSKGSRGEKTEKIFSRSGRI